MVLHKAAHLFQDGEINGGVKDLLDIQGQLEAFAGREGFFAHLLDRGRRLDLERPLYYALRYAMSLLDAPIPQEVLRETHAMGPPAPVVALMDRLVRRVLDPPYPVRREPVVSQWLLYVRSHWLRMPPGLLTSHLSRKAWRQMGAQIGNP